MEVETFKMIAKTYEGLEDVLGRELMRMGAEDVNTEPCTVTFTGNKHLLYEANYELRTALRIYKEIFSFSFESESEFFDKLKEYRWSKILNIYKSFNATANVNSEKISKQTDVAAKLTENICAYFNEKSRKTPPHGVKSPSVIIKILVNNNNCQILLDSTGDSLSQRGYRTAGGIDHLNEVYAAGLVQLSGWKANSNFIDPMCGSGTLLIEAAMLAYNIPAQICRENFNFFTWRDFDADMWHKIKADARERIKHNGEFVYKIIGYDISEAATKAANQNIKKAILDKYIVVHTASAKDLKLDGNNNTLLIDMPKIDNYKKEETKNTLNLVSQLIKRNIKNAKIWLHSNQPDIDRSIGLNIQKEFSIVDNGTTFKIQLF